MASFTRRMQRMPKREQNGHKNQMKFGSKLGVHNEDATDLVARTKREENK